MKYVVLFLLGILLVVGPAPRSTSGANDPFNVTSSLFYADFPSSGGQKYIDIYVQNTLDIEQTITVSPWYYYVDLVSNPDPEATGGYIKESWVPSVTPNSLVLGPKQSALFSVLFSVPADAEELVYKTWIKVSNGSTLSKPITVWVRKGKAVPVYDFALSSGSYFKLLVTGSPAYLVSDNPQGIAPIAVRSKSNTNTRFYASIESPGYDDYVTQERIDDTGSKLFYGKQEELDNTYKALSREEANKWAKIGIEGRLCSKEQPLLLAPYATGTIPWSLTIPDRAKNGCYWFWIRVAPAEAPNQSISINYVSKVYITIDREPPREFNQMWFAVAGLGGLILLGIGYIGVSNVLAKRNERKSAKPGISAYKMPKVG